MPKTKLYMTKGLPASGKSTWAKAQNAKRVNRDDLRNMIDKGEWSKANEKFIVKLEQDIVIAYLGGQYNVIVDDTNLSPKNEIMWKTIAEEFGAEFEVKDFTDVPLDVCITRDALRDNSVGKKVIVGMYNQFLRNNNDKKPLNPVIYDNSLPYCVIFDLDGTLAHITDRSPYDGKSCGSDLVNESIQALFQILKDRNRAMDWKKWSSVDLDIIILSGRNGDSRKETEQWLVDNNLHYDQLIMRKEGDSRKDSVIKKELFDENIRDKYNVLFIVDDRDQVVELWRSMGITCLQCNYGNF